MDKWKLFKRMGRWLFWPPFLLIATVFTWNLWNIIDGSTRVEALPIVFNITLDQPTEGVLAALDAAHYWNKALGIEAITINLTDVPTSTQFGGNDGRNDIIFSNHQRAALICDELAHATVHMSLIKPGIIKDVDIIIPDFIRTFSENETTYKPGSVEKYYLAKVMVHEMGHALGLKHFLYPRSIMRPYESLTLEDIIENDIREYAATPSRFDVKLVQKKYPEYFKATPLAKD